MSERGQSAQIEAGMDDLAPRLVSALVLMPLAIGAALAGGKWLAGAAGAAIVAMSYEYARMSERENYQPAFAICVAAALGGVMAQSWGETGWALAWIGLFALITAARRRGGVAGAEAALGVLYVAAAPVLFLDLRAHAFGGLAFVLGLFIVIWSADIAAYFAGRMIGGPKLAPSISPKKTWAGSVAAVLAGAAAGASCAALFEGSVAAWVLSGAVLAVVGLGGDLFESALKRRFGVKDASRLIPGHGGVLDRLDGLIAATVFAALVIALSPGLAGVLVGEGS